MRIRIYPDIALLFAVVCVLSCGDLQAQTYRILPLGNSITQGMGEEYLAESDRISYRKKLYDLLTAGGNNFDFVGHRNAGYAFFPDADHGGIPGTRAQYLVRLLEDGYDERWGAQITAGGAPYLDVYPADIILLHIGTNDITHGEGSGTGDIVNILNQIDEWEAASGTHVVVFLAQIIQRSDTPANNTITKQYNDNLAALVASRNDPSVILVDIESGAGINYSTELMPDGIHPSQSAYDKMGSKWYSSLNSYLSSIPASPDGLSVGGASATSIQLSWNDNSNNETAFEIERSATSDPGSFALIHNAGPGSRSYTDTGLDENTQYYYRVRAVNSTGPSLYTSIRGSTTLTGELAAPGGLQASAMGAHSIGILWTDNSSSETAFIIERSEQSGTGFVAIHSTSANETSYVDNPLTDGTEYFYRVRATNGVVYSNYSQQASAFTELSAPTELSASPVDENSIQLTWTDNSVSEIAYIIERSNNSVSGFSMIQTTNANTTTYTDRGLTDGIRYFYRIRASQVEIQSTYTAVVSGTTPLAAPSGLTATALNESTIKLDWTDNSRSESGYLIERSDDMGNSYKVIGVVAANIVSFTDEGLENGSQLVYRIRATSGSMYSEYSNPASAGANLVAPSSLIANPLDNTRILISWTDESYSETAYIIERSENSGSGYAGIHAVAANETSYEDSGLADGRTYYYRVRGTNGTNSSEPSNEASATTHLASPSGLLVGRVDEGSIDLVWTDNSVSESGYSIERSSYSDTGFTELETTPANTNSYTDRALADGTTYFYRIRAIKGETFSMYSNQVGTSTRLAAPTGLTALAVQEGTVNLSWVDNSVSETAYIIERSDVSGSGFAEIFRSQANAESYADSEADGKESYHYRIRATNGVLYSDYSEEIQSVRSIPLSDSLFSFYPNPSQGQITIIIQAKEELVSDASVRLIDFSGKVHFYEELDLSDGRQVELVEIELPSHIKNGFYSLSLSTGIRIVSEKFVLIR